MKAKNTLKKLGCALAVAACVTGTTAPMVHATTTDFTFTVSSKPSLNTDTMSKRTMKADNEQRYYAKATSFSAAGTIYVHSRKNSGTAFGLCNIVDSYYMENNKSGF